MSNQFNQSNQDWQRRNQEIMNTHYADLANHAHAGWTNGNSISMNSNIPNQQLQNMTFNSDGTLSAAGLAAFNASLNNDNDEQDGGLHSYRKSRRARKSRRSHKSRK